VLLWERGDQTDGLEVGDNIALIVSVGLSPSLKSEINLKAQALLEKSVDATQKEKQIGELNSQLESLGEKQRLSHLLTRVGAAAQKKLLDSPEFRSQFDRESPCSAYVLSIDIRRSNRIDVKGARSEAICSILNDSRKPVERCDSGKHSPLSPVAEIV
jgi:hypothetical protein